MTKKQRSRAELADLLDTIRDRSGKKVAPKAGQTSEVLRRTNRRVEMQKGRTRRVDSGDR